MDDQPRGAMPHFDDVPAWVLRRDEGDAGSLFRVGRPETRRWLIGVNEAVARSWAESWTGSKARRRPVQAVD